MKTFFFSLTIFAITFSTTLKSQNFYIPRNVLKSYKNDIRTFEGKPGKKYWQNYADYFIEAKINPKTRELTGREEVIYHNRSPYDLTQIILRTYPDHYKKGRQRDTDISPKAVNNGMVFKSLKVNDESINLSGESLNFTRRGTNAFLRLPETLPSGKSIDIQVEWSFIIPNISQERMGAYDSTSFFVAYWYPQISVFDDVDGWDVFNYRGTTEFYNDFNNYLVKITLPEGFLVWGTGTVQNLNDLLKDKFLKRIKKAKTSDKVINIVTKDDYAKGSPTITDNFNTWVFKAKNLTDFTFGTSDHYLWDMRSVIVNDSTQRRVWVEAVYKKESKEFYKAAEIAAKSIRYLSTELPGYPYPYSKMTIFNGRGGMESPMMVNEGSPSTYAGMVGVTSHEIAHTYFPFYMGINERKYAWMDEGWATMLPMEFQKKEGKYDPLASNVRGFSYVAGNELELPMIIPSVYMLGATYRDASYTRPGIAYYYLMDLMGRKEFKKALRNYIKNWHGRHPLPYDFFLSFNNSYGKDLSWFWKPWFFERGYPDLAVENVKESGNNLFITIEKIGLLPVPIGLLLTFEDGSTQTFWNSAEAWKDGNTKTTVVIATNKKIKQVEIIKNKVADVNESNNIWEK